MVVSRDVDGFCDEGGCCADGLCATDGSGRVDGLWAFAMPTPASVMNAATATSPFRFFCIVELLPLGDDGLLIASFRTSAHTCKDGAKRASP
jgi:hypothetical protein